MMKLNLMFIFLIALLLTGCIENYEVEFNALGGTEIQSISVKSGSYVNSPITLKEGHTLEGWYTSSDQGITFEDAWSFETDIVFSNLVLYAKWVVNDYTITFDSQGGSAIDHLNLPFNSDLMMPTPPSRDGYVFDGWFIDDLFETAFIENKMSASNIVLYAKWLEAEESVLEIAMITDGGHVNDYAYNQATWEGIVSFSEDKDINYTYYVPTNITTLAYVESITLAVNNGASVIVTAGFTFENAVWICQSLFPDITFILIDGSPHNIDLFNPSYTLDGQNIYDDFSVVDFTIRDNVLSIFFNEQDSGFLAGYAAVMEGFDQLGFMGGLAVPAILRYGIGYLSGAYYAAHELELINFEVEAQYYDYLGGFSPDPSYRNKALSWYSSGVDVIFTIAGPASLQIASAAEESIDSYLIGVDFDQAILSQKVITSATKSLSKAIEIALNDYMNGSFEGGRTLHLEAKDNSVALPTNQASFRFNTFTLSQYEDILSKLMSGDIIVPKTIDELKDFLLQLDYEVSQELMTKIKGPH